MQFEVCPLLAVDEMVRELLGVLAEPVDVELLDRVADTAMKLPLAFAEQAVVRDVLDHGVLEDVRRLGGQGKAFL